MAIIVPRKVVPIEEARPAPQVKSLTEAEVRALLEQQAEAFSEQIKAVTAAFSSALASASQKPKDKTITGWDFAVKYDNQNVIQTISATARTKQE